MVTSTAPKVKISLPALHNGRTQNGEGLGGQREIELDDSRFKVIVCGRRWGKTTLGVHKCVGTALTGGRVWWVAPTYKVAHIGWRMARHLARQLSHAGIEVNIREADRMISFPGDGEFWIKSADDPDNLRGEGLDGVVLDEFAFMKQAAWSEALRPALSDKLGWAIFIGTPNGKNWAYQLYQLAQLRDGWAAWTKPTRDNPYISLDEIEQAREEYPTIELFQQEYEADFGASQLQVYPTFNRQLHSWKWDVPEFDYFIGGLDFGGTTIGSHKSAGIFGGVTKGGILVELYEFEQSGPNVGERQIEWMAQCEAQALMLQKRHGHRANRTFLWRADKTQMRFIELMRTAGYSIMPSRGGPNSVQAGVQLVQARLQVRGDGKARIYYSPDLKAFPDAMERYRYPELKDGDTKPQSPNPLKVDDDLADAIRYQIEGEDIEVIGDPNEVYGSLLPTIKSGYMNTREAAYWSVKGT